MSLSVSDDDNEGSYSSTDDSSSGDDGAHQHLQSQSSVEEEIDHNAKDARSLVLFDTMEMSETDFLMPGGLNSFSVVALPAKRDKLVLKDLPKTTKASGVYNGRDDPFVQARSNSSRSSRRDRGGRHNNHHRSRSTSSGSSHSRNRSESRGLVPILAGALCNILVLNLR